MLTFEELGRICFYAAIDDATFPAKLIGAAEKRRGCVPASWKNFWSGRRRCRKSAWAWNAGVQCGLSSKFSLNKFVYQTA